jgi:hypothetical protein
MTELLAALPAAGATPGQRIPFVIDHPRLRFFIGRDESLRQLHDLLLAGASGGRRPVGISGMGGVGKTQLAVEYAYRYRYYYPGGVFLINARSDWAGEFARLAGRLGLVHADQRESISRDEMAAAMSRYVERNSETLLIFDGVDEPADLSRKSIAFGQRPAHLACRLLFTTRQRFSGNGLQPVTIDVLEPDQARAVLAQWRPDLAGEPAEVVHADLVNRPIQPSAAAGGPARPWGAAVA